MKIKACFFAMKVDMANNDSNSHSWEKLTHFCKFVRRYQMSHFNMQYFTDKINSNIFPLSFLEKHLSKRKIIYIDLAKPKSGACIFFFCCMSQHLALARTRTQVIRLGAQCTDHWTTVIWSSTQIFFGLMGYYYFVLLWGYALRAPL